MTGIQRKPTPLDVSGGTSIVHSGPCLLKGVYINIATNGYAIELQDNSVMKFTIPANVTAGNFYDFYDSKFHTDLKVVPNASSTGNITLVFEPIFLAGTNL